MPNESPLLKRIKRHITGRVRDYFVSTGPGFEKICYNELMALPLSVKDAMPVKGGVEFKGRFADCCLANLNLRTANRVLMRIDLFKASNFSQLQRKVSEIPWELYLDPGHMLEFRVSTSHSRLYHKEAIAQRIEQSISARFSDAKINKDLYPQKIFVRSEDDWISISIDSSGENLYKRGIKTHGGNAPVRETLAAAGLKIGGYDGNMPVIDPMCGSGTFSLEAALMCVKIPPGYFRDFAFMEWPCFNAKRWEYIKKEAGQGRVIQEKPMIFASDMDENICKSLKKCVNDNGLAGLIKVSRANFFEFSPKEFTDTPGIVIINPPYGLRLGTQEESAELFAAIGKHLKNEYKGWKFALIAPNKSLTASFPFKIKTHSLFHGGLNLVLFTGKVLQ
ncbi:SAM-dependent RNA methylase [Desulfonema limicola]|uniref:SAM-dependent RNA methylase n=1 Tax=Desulfonema limicola TaxID=45656 RepID=A0A975BBL6_9BACT|nr:hypothetical protein [Desulfonema limicola]QTA82417.1 SAM-dependent RNA methylase [Desulfonema limicola]